MKITKKHIFTGLATIWVAFIAVWYFKEHPDYWQFMDMETNVLRAYLYSIIYIVLSSGIIYLTFKKVLSFFRIISLLIALALILSAIVFSVKGFQIYTGPTLVKAETGETYLKPQELITIKDKILIPTGYKFLHKDIRPENWHPKMEEYIEKFSYAKFIFNIFINLLEKLLFFILFGSVLFGIGSKFLHHIYKRREIEELDFFLLSTGIGSMILAFYLFFAASIGRLDIWSLLVFTIISFTLGYKKIFFTLKKLFTKKLSFGIESRSVTFFALALFIAIFANFLIRNIMPYPINSDDFVLYMKIPKLLAENKELLNGHGSYAGGLLYSIGFILQDSLNLTATIFFYYVILGLIGLFSILKKFLAKETSILTTCIFALTPTIMYQSAIYIKLEMLMVFFTIISILAFYYWWKENDHKRVNKSLLLSLFVLGFIFSIKYTGIISVFSALVLLAYYFFNSWIGIAVFSGILGIIFKTGNATSLTINNLTPETIGFISNACFAIGLIFLIIGITKLLPACTSGFAADSKKTTKQNFISCALIISVLIVPMTPWLAKNFIENTGQNITIGNLLTGRSETPIIEFDEKQNCVNTELYEYDYGRFIGQKNDKKLSKIFLYPWYITMAPELKNMYLDIGFYLMAFLPLLIILVWKRARKDILFFIIPFYFYWAIMAKGTIWYGITAYPILILLLGIYFDKIKGILRLISLISIAFAILITVLVWNSLWISNTDYNIGYAGGYNTDDTIIKAAYPGYIEISKFLNKPENKDMKILSTITSLSYFIENSHKRLIPDKYFDNIKCLNNQNNALQTLKSNNIKFVVLFGNTESLEVPKTNEIKKEFLSFADQNLKKLYASPSNNILFEVP